MFDSIIHQDCRKIIEKINFSDLKNKSVLVTGASGLIGIYLISCLKMVSESLNIKIFAWIKSDIEKEFKTIFEGCEIIQEDITQNKIFDTIDEFDTIFHCAGYGQPGKFLQDKLKTILINTNSTINLFNKLKPNGKFLFVSTSEIYSGLNYENIEENEIGNTNTDHVRACYIEGKRCGESICYSFIDKGYDVKIVRLSLAYGPGTKKDDHRVMNSLIQKGILNNEINLLDDGSSIRTYCYITDAIEMFFNIILFGKKEIYNVGGNSQISIFELAEMIGKKLNKTVNKSTNSTTLEGTPKVVNSSIKRYIEEFGKKEFISLEKGLDFTINWQQQLYK